MERMRALVTGINGMDGSHLADLLLGKGYEVFGMERRTSSPNRTNSSHLEGKIHFINGDLTDQNSLFRALKTYKAFSFANKVLVFDLVIEESSERLISIRLANSLAI